MADAREALRAEVPTMGRRLTDSLGGAQATAEALMGEALEEGRAEGLVAASAALQANNTVKRSGRTSR
jgi:hypothetical protein